MARHRKCKGKPCSTRKQVQLFGKNTLLDFPPIHPGEIPQEEFLVPLGISQNALARSMRVPPGRINDIVNHKRGISAETALRLGCALGTTPEFWLNLQMKYDLDSANESTHGQICKEVIPLTSTQS